MEPIVLAWVVVSSTALALAVTFAVLFVLRPTAKVLASGTLDPVETASGDAAFGSGALEDRDFDLLPALEIDENLLLPTPWDVTFDPRARLLPPVNQGTCNACWAHALTNALSDQVALLANEKPIALDAQALFCSGAQVVKNGDYCAIGGYVTRGIEYLQRTGVTRNADETTQAALTAPPPGACTQVDNLRVYVDPDSVRRVAATDAVGSTAFHNKILAIKRWLVSRGPAVVTFAIGTDFLRRQTYSSLAQPYVRSTTAGSAGLHTVELVGFHHPAGNAADYTGAYWILKNSYGPAWGFQGYFSLPLGRNEYGVESKVYLFAPLMYRNDAQVAFRNVPVYVHLQQDDELYSWYLYEAIFTGAMGLSLLVLVYFLTNR